MNCVGVRCIQHLFVDLHVNKTQIRTSLLLAPLYACLISFSILYAIIVISNGLSFSSTLELLPIFAAYSAIILVSYYGLTCIFIYFAQLWLFKRNQLNFFSIMLSAILLSSLFILIVWLIGPILRAMTPAIVIIAMPIALCFWCLLRCQHQKNIK